MAVFEFCLSNFTKFSKLSDKNVKLKTFPVFEHAISCFRDRDTITVP